MTTREAALKYHDLGFLPIPIGAGRPLVEWRPLQAGFERERIEQWAWEDGLGLIIQGFEVLDFDLKNTKRTGIYEQWKEVVQFIKPDILDGMLIIATKSRGFHVIYRTDISQGSQKLAVGADNRTIIETRGIGGLVFTMPSPGYTKLQGSWSNLKSIDKEERDLLLQAARAFTEEKAKEPEEVKSAKPRQDGESVFQRYNNETDTVELLQGNGWQVASRGRNKTFLNRPGGGGKDPSGNVKDNVFYCFSTSQNDVPVDKGLSAFDLFVIYEHGGDMKAATRALYERYEPKQAPIAEEPPPASERPYQWNKMDKVQDLEPFLSFHGDVADRPYIPKFGLLTITGQAGSYKTAIMRAICAAMLSGKPKAACKVQATGRILLFDTELSKSQFQRNMTNIYAQAGQRGDDRIRAFWLTPYSASERKSWIDRIIAEEGAEADLIIVDGWRDLLLDFNDNKEVEALVAQITKWRESSKAVMCGVIHLNPGTSKMRGTLGTELMNKSDGVIQVERNTDTGTLQMRFQRGRAWATPAAIQLFVDDNHQAFAPSDPDRQYQPLPNVNETQMRTGLDDFVPF